MTSFLAALASQLRGCSSAVQSYSRDAARALVVTRLSAFSTDLLQVQDAFGTQLAVFGDPKAHHLQAPAVLVIHDDFFWVRVLFLGDIGFAQSYMLGEVSTPNLTAVFTFFIRNATQQSQKQKQKQNQASIIVLAGSQLLLSTLGRVMGAALLCSAAAAKNSVSVAKLNAAAHYSLSNDMFAAFLDPSMTYSAALWLPATDPGARDETLQQAQRRKLEYAVSAARIKPTDHVLEVGTGWGSFAILAVQSTGCRVTTVTPSLAQKGLAERRVAEAGLEDRIRVLLGDYREIPSLLRSARRTSKSKSKSEAKATDTDTSHDDNSDDDDDDVDDVKFDKIVSIEMIEHVGPQFLDTYFACMDAYLKEDGGVGYFQGITMPEARYAAGYGRRGARHDFIQQYMFPGGHLPTLSGLVAAINAGSRGRLVVHDMLSLGGHYVKTLQCWRESFLERFDGEIAVALRREKPGMTDGEMDVFRRKWHYYFCYCEAGFKTKTLGNVGITVAREGALELLEGIPFERD